MTRPRPLNLNVKVDEDEMGQIHALASAEDMPIAMVVRRFIRRAYAERFGDAAVPMPEMKHKPRKRRKGR